MSKAPLELGIKGGAQDPVGRDRPQCGCRCRSLCGRPSQPIQRPDRQRSRQHVRRRRYAISLLSLDRPSPWKRGAARFSGIILLVFAAGIVEAARRYFARSEPIGATVIIMAVVAGSVNLLCLILLKRLRHKDVNLRAATTFSLNDFIAKGGILVSGAVVLWTGMNWPDLIITVAIAALAMKAGIDILAEANRDAATAQGN